MKIKVHTPGAESGYDASVDTGVADVTITEARRRQSRTVAR